MEVKGFAYIKYLNSRSRLCVDELSEAIPRCTCAHLECFVSSTQPNPNHCIGTDHSFALHLTRRLHRFDHLFSSVRQTPKVDHCRYSRIHSSEWDSIVFFKEFFRFLRALQKLLFDSLHTPLGTLIGQVVFFSQRPCDHECLVPEVPDQISVCL